MTYSHEVERMCPLTKGPNHGPAPIPEEGQWVKAYQISDISGLTHGVGWCAPQQGTCKLTLNVKKGVIEEALVETIGCSGMTHSAAMAGEILPGKTILEALNTDLVCDAINVAMRELFLQIVYGRSQTAFSDDGLPVGAGLEDLGKGLRSMTGTIFSTKAKGVRYLELTEGYITKVAVDENGEAIGYQFVRLGKMMEDIRHGVDPKTAYEKNIGTYGRFADAPKYIDPREESERRRRTMAKFESQERRMPKIEACLKANGLESLDACREMLLSKGIDVDAIVKGVQPICFENAVWAYTLGTAIAVKRGLKSAADCAAAIGEGLEAFTIPGSVAEQRAVGLGHGNLGAMLLRDETKCFAFLAGHESFAAAEGAIGIARTANKARKEPLRVILNGLGKDAAYIISRINGFTYVETDYDFKTGELKVVREKAFSDGERAAVKCYGANDVLEGVAIMKKEGVEVSITGNSTNPTRFQHLVAGTYKKWAMENGKKYFSVASGGGTGRTLHPDNVAAGPASYGLTDSMGRMHGDAQFAGSSSVPAHVEMMGLIGMGNNPMVGATVACAVAASQA